MWAEAPLGLFDLGTRNLLIMSGVYKQRRGLTVPSHFFRLDHSFLSCTLSCFENVRICLGHGKVYGTWSSFWIRVEPGEGEGLGMGACSEELEHEKK